MDHVLDERGERATIVGATSGDTGGAAIEAFRGPQRVDIFILYPAGPRLATVQRRQMTTVDGRQRPRHRGRGQFRRLPGAGEGDVQRSRLPRRGRPVRRQLDQLGADRGADRLLLHRGGRARRAAPPVSFTVPTGNFGDIFAGYVAKRMGLPIDRLIDRHQRQRHPGAHARRPAATRSPASSPTTSPSMDIQVSSNFERLLFEAHGRDGAAVRRLMASLSQVRSLRHRGRRRWRRSGATSRQRGAARTPSPPRWARPGATRAICSIRTPRSASPARAECSRPTRHVPMVALRHRPSRQVPRRGGGRHRRASRRCRRTWPTCTSARSASPCCPTTRSRSSASCAAMAAPPGEAPHERVPSHARQARDSSPLPSPAREAVQVTTLPNGLRVVTEHMPQLDTAALGVWIAAGTRHEQQGEQGLAHLLEHMAFKGTSAAHARCRSSRRSRPSAATSTPRPASERTSYYARVLGDDVPLALDILSDILTEPAFDTDELKREKGVVLCRRSAPARTRPTTSSSTCSRRRPSRRSRSAAASSARPRPCARRPPASMRGLSRPAIPRARHGAGGRRRGGPRPGGRRGRAPLRSISAEAATPAVAGPYTRRRRAQGAQARAGASRARLRGPLASTTRTTTRCTCSPTCSAAACPRGCSRRSARSAASATRSTPSTGPSPTPASSRIYAGTGEKDVARVRCRSCWMRARRGRAPNEAEVARAKAQIKVSLLMGLE